jgi:pilus assembly protein Flp/PilA
MSGSQAVSGVIGSGVRFLNDERGATSIEYAIIAGMLSIAIVVAVNAIGTSLNTRFDSIATGIK